MSIFKLPYDYKPKKEVVISKSTIENVKKIYKKITGHGKRFKSHECDHCVYFTRPSECPYPIKHPCPKFEKEEP